MPCDYKLYPENWFTEIRPLILRRAGARPERSIQANCEWCELENYATLTPSSPTRPEPSRVVLTIAHLDQDVTNNDPENLAALCQRCHLKWDRPWHLINAGLTRDRHRNQSLLPGIDPKEWRNHVKKKQLTHSFNVLLEEEDVSMLSMMAEKTSTNMSIVIRQAIKWRYLLEIDNVPTCSNGRPCFVPHMHTAPAPSTQGTPP